MDVLETAKQKDIPQKVKKRITERRVLIIVHQSRRGVTNFNACKSIQLNGGGIEAFYLDGTKKTIAFYEEAGRSDEVFHDMVTAINSDLLNTLYMPEE